MIELQRFSDELLLNIDRWNEEFAKELKEWELPKPTAEKSRRLGRKNEPNEKKKKEGADEWARGQNVY